PKRSSRCRKVYRSSKGSVRNRSCKTKVAEYGNRPAAVIGHSDVRQPVTVQVADGDCCGTKVGVQKHFRSKTNGPDSTLVLVDGYAVITIVSNHNLRQPITVQVLNRHPAHGVATGQIDACGE